MNSESNPSSASWPFPSAGSHRRSESLRTTPLNPSEIRPDPVEQELVAEQLERDRKASRAVDPQRVDRV